MNTNLKIQFFFSNFGVSKLYNLKWALNLVHYKAQKICEHSLDLLFVQILNVPLTNVLQAPNVWVNFNSYLPSQQESHPVAEVSQIEFLVKVVDWSVRNH